jgi:hypothetical protein
MSYSTPRICSHCGRAANKSGYHGVHMREADGRTYFVARLRGDYLGNFPIAIDAAKAYDREVRKLGLEKVLNFPEVNA